MTHLTDTVSLWATNVFIDIPTLQLVTRGEAEHSSHGFTKTMLNLLPRDDIPFALSPNEPIEERNKSKAPMIDTSSRQNLSPLVWNSTQRSDKELEKLQRSPHLRKHALGPGHAGIVNLGATGYISSTLQILYLLKPIRNVSPILPIPQEVY